MHYVGMAAATVHLHPVADTAGDPPGRLIAPLMIGPLLFLLLAGVVVVLDPAWSAAPSPPSSLAARLPRPGPRQLPPAARRGPPRRALRPPRAARPRLPRPPRRPAPARPGARRRTGPHAGQRR
ncbi:hypothetical protein ACFQVA_07935 [Actinomadura keratinilytica]